MMLPALHSVIRRRLLVNFRIDPDVARRLLPPPFEPLLVSGEALAGICLIRLERIAPAFLARAPFGFSSENAAHRMAVAWRDPAGLRQEGVYIFRRDSTSWLSAIAGGRLFPGRYHRAAFVVRDDGETVDLDMRSRDGAIAAQVRGRTAACLPRTSIFASLEESSRFFAAGSTGYSPDRDASRLAGFRLETSGWRVAPFAVDLAWSSFLADPTRFPTGSAVFDHALVMRDHAADWLVAPELRPPCACPGAAVPASTARS